MRQKKCKLCSEFKDGIKPRTRMTSRTYPPKKNSIMQSTVTYFKKVNVCDECFEKVRNK